jgi:hypothetical protein
MSLEIAVDQLLFGVAEVPIEAVVKTGVLRPSAGRWRTYFPMLLERALTLV